MGYRRTAHPYHGGEIDHTFLAVAQQPENTQATAVPQLLKKYLTASENSPRWAYSAVLAPWAVHGREAKKWFASDHPPV